LDGDEFSQQVQVEAVTIANTNPKTTLATENTEITKASSAEATISTTASSTSKTTTTTITTTITITVILIYYQKVWGYYFFRGAIPKQLWVSWGLNLKRGDAAIKIFIVASIYISNWFLKQLNRSFFIAPHGKLFVQNCVFQQIKLGVRNKNEVESK
jgi:hypothetical protein